MFGMRKGNKKGQAWETLIPWIIGVIALVLIIILFMILSGKGSGAITYFKNLVRFGR